MFEISQYLYRVEQALKEKNPELLQEIGKISEQDDQYDYEDKDLREIMRHVELYIDSQDETARQDTLTLIEEFQ